MGVIMLVLMGLTFYHSYYQGDIAKYFDQKLVIKFGTPVIQVRGSQKEVAMIRLENDESPLYTVGIRNGDMLADISLTRFYRLLHHNRGKKVSISFIDGSGEMQEGKEKIKQITITVPE